MKFSLIVDIFVFTYHVKPLLTPQVIHVWNFWFTICLIVHHMLFTWLIVPFRHVTFHIRKSCTSLQGRHNGHDGVSNHQPHDCLLNHIIQRRPKKTSKLRVTGLCVGNSPVTGEFLAQMVSNAENVSIWWRQHDTAINSPSFSSKQFIKTYIRIPWSFIAVVKSSL